MNRIAHHLCTSSHFCTKVLDSLQAPVSLAIRLYLFQVFFWSGWLKLQSWASTVALFQYEYKVPLLSPNQAAILGTAFELVLPVLVLLGLGGRLSAFLFFIFNITNVLFYPLLLTPEYHCAMKDHVIWGILIGILVLYGLGKWSADYFLQKKFCKN